MRSLVRGSGPTYAPLESEARDGRFSPMEMERRPMLNDSERDADNDGDGDDVGFDYEKSRPNTLRERFAAWNAQRRRPVSHILFIALALFVSLAAGAWAYRRLFPGYDPLPTYDEPEALEPQPLDGTITLTDASNVLVPVRAALAATENLLSPVDTRPPLDILVHYYTTGELPGAVHHPQQPLDLVYLYVNSTSRYFQDARAARLKAEDLTLKVNKERHWRDNGELRGAMRSGALSLAGRVGRIHVVSAAYDFDSSKYPPRPHEGVTGWRMGQIPAWLNWANRSNVNWYFQPTVFRLPRDHDGQLPESIAQIDEVAWQNKSLPSFNSFAIEARIPWINGMSEEIVYSNDDMFLLRDMTHGDFHHPLYGSVFRLDPALDVKPHLNPADKSDSGEGGGLAHANVLISGRFRQKNRLYVQHMSKAMKRSLLHEASVMFAAPLAEAATRGFRESKRGVADVEMSWLVTYLQMERWREALLWTWAVARVGGLDGSWGRDARDELRKVLRLSRGAEKGVKAEIEISKKGRSTLANFDHVSEQGGWEMPQRSDILYTSLDGHMSHAPYSAEEWKLREKLLRKPRKGVRLRPVPPTTCTFDVDECLPADFWENEDKYTAADMFKRLAFEKGECGDCLIHALVGASGSQGLRAFLPPPDKMFTPLIRDRRPMWDRPEPMLPLTPTWGEADFSLAHNVRLGQDQWTRTDGKQSSLSQVNLLDWSVKLMSRYAYVYATTPWRFTMVHSVYQLHRALKELSTDDNIAMACLNDDQPDKPHPHIRVQLQRWMNDMFGQASKFVQWERADAAWELEDKDENEPQDLDDE